MVSKSLFTDVHTVLAHWKLLRARWIIKILKMFGMGRKVLSRGPFDLRNLRGQQYSMGYALVEEQGFTFW